MGQSFLSKTQYQSKEEFCRYFIKSAIDDLSKFKKNLRARCDRDVEVLGLLAEEITTHKNQIKVLPDHIMADHVIGSIVKKIKSDADPKNEIVDYAQEYANLGRHDFQSLIEKNILKLSLVLRLNFLHYISSILTKQKSGTAIVQFFKLFDNSFKQFRNHAWGGEYEEILILEIFRQDYVDAMIKEFRIELSNSVYEVVIKIYFNRIGNLIEQYHIIRKQLEAKYENYNDIAGAAYHITTYFQNTYWESLKLVADRMYRLIKKKIDLDLPYIVYADKRVIKEFMASIENQIDLKSSYTEAFEEENGRTLREDHVSSGDSRPNTGLETDLPRDFTFEDLFNEPSRISRYVYALRKVVPAAIDKDCNYLLGPRKKSSIAAWIDRLKEINIIKLTLNRQLLASILSDKFTGLKLGKDGRTLSNKEGNTYPDFKKQFEQLLKD